MISNTGQIACKYRVEETAKRSKAGVELFNFRLPYTKPLMLLWILLNFSFNYIITHNIFLSLVLA